VRKIEIKTIRGVFFIAVFAIFFVSPFSVSANSAITINEIMYDLPGTDANHEWIEIYNSGPDEADLTNWKFNDGDDPTNHALNEPPKNASRGSMIIPAGGYLVLTGNASTTVSDLPNYNGTIIDTVMNLSNTAATLKLFGRDGAQVTSAYYNKEMGATGNNKSLERNGASFKESYRDGGTPGAPNSILSEAPPSPAATPGQSPIATSSDQTHELAPQDTSGEPSYAKYSDKIFINEFMPWPSGGKEWVELINAGNDTIDISAWQIDDGPEGSTSQKIPESSIIEPGDFLAIELNKDILNNDGDQVQLAWPDEQIIHSVSYKNAKQGFSSARFEAGLWLWTNQPTPGQANKRSVSQNTSPIPSSQAPTLEADVLTEQVSDLPKQSPQDKESSAPQNIAQTQSQPSQLFASQLPADNSSSDNAQKQNSPVLSQNHNSNRLYLALGTTIVLGLLSGLGLVRLRRKDSIDSP